VPLCRDGARLIWNVKCIEMNDKDINDLVQAWLAYQRNWWAFERMMDLIMRQPDQAWTVLKTLTEKAETDALLEAIGAGPLEDFIENHGTEYEKTWCQATEIRYFP